MNKKLIWYHGCSKNTWELIKKEGVLFGQRGSIDRCTHLASDMEEAIRYGDVILTVIYDPTKNPTMNNCPIDFDCFQIRVYEPIPFDQLLYNEVPYKLRKEIPLIYNEYLKEI